MSARGLCIGINDYPGVDSDLNGCVNDAHDWKDALAERGFAVSLLLDADATKEAMVDAIEATVLATKPGETSVITFSGHGSFVPDGDDEEQDGFDEIVCPFDIGSGRWITDDEMYGLFSRKASGASIVFIADSCHSGTIGRLFAPLFESGPPRRIRFLPPGAFLAETQLPARRGVVRARSKTPARPPMALTLSGCEDGQTSDDDFFDGRANGAMTFYALRTLSALSENADYRAWFTELRKLLPNQRNDQAPQMDGLDDQKEQRVLRPSPG